MTSRDHQVRGAIAEQASEWFVANDEAPLEGQDAAQLVAWLKASPQHVGEFLGIAAIARDLHAAPADPDSSLELLLARARADQDGPIERIRPAALASLTELSLRRWRFAAVTAAA